MPRWLISKNSNICLEEMQDGLISCLSLIFRLCMLLGSTMWLIICQEYQEWTHYLCRNSVTWCTHVALSIFVMFKIVPIWQFLTLFRFLMILPVLEMYEKHRRRALVIGTLSWSSLQLPLEIFSLKMVFYVSFFKTIFALWFWIVINSNQSLQIYTVVHLVVI